MSIFQYRFEVRVGLRNKVQVIGDQSCGIVDRYDDAGLGGETRCGQEPWNTVSDSPLKTWLTASTPIMTE